MAAPALDWLPNPAPDQVAGLRVLVADNGWEPLVAAANTRLDSMSTLQVDRALRRLYGDTPPAGLATRPLRMLVLGSSTLDHLLPGLRVGALRHGLWLNATIGDYGQTDLGDERPDVVLFALDARHALAGLNARDDAAAAATALDAAVAAIAAMWRAARAAGAAVLQQTILPVFAPQFGSNEHRLPGSRAAGVVALNARLRTLADAEGVDLVDITSRAARDGIAAWHDPMLWHRAKQEVHPGAAPLYGDLVARLLAARQGRSRKALVLDLDNTLWGGVIRSEEHHV